MPTVRSYSTCSRAGDGGVTTLLLNLTAHGTALRIARPGGTNAPVRLVTAPLGSRQVRLDGEPLALGPGGELPALPSTQAPYAVVALPPTSYASVTQPNAGARACGVRR